MMAIKSKNSEKRWPKLVLEGASIKGLGPKPVLQSGATKTRT